MEILQFHNVSFSYPGMEEKALSQVSFAIQEGSFALLCGPSGCGKSTLLRQIKKSISPYGKKDGYIEFDGISLDDLSEKDSAVRIGFVGQNPDDQIVSNIVWHELAFGMENMGLPRDLMHRRIAEISEFFGIQDLYQRDTGSLSGGQKQMINLAAVMVMQPDILLLDEPTSQLDPLAASEFLHLLTKINRELGTTILLSEHHLEEVFGMVDTCLYMENARLLWSGTPQEVAQKMICEEKGMYLGLPSALRISQGLLAEEEKTPNLPLTVVEGRKFLREKFQQSDYQPRVEQWKKQCNNHHPIEESTTDILQMKHVNFAYEGQRVSVLHDFSISIKQGEWFALLGGNGTGKSTVLKLLCQNIQQDRGDVFAFGKRIRKAKDMPLGYQKMVYLPQDPKALFVEITVQEELEEIINDLPLSEMERSEKVSAMLVKLGLQGKEKQHPYDLSGGQQQMLAIGKLLLLEPKVILLDEPTKGLDPETKHSVGEFLKGLQKEGTTLVMVSHDVEFCAEFADRCGLLFQGQLVAASETRMFFCGNQFFTTAANRIARKFCNDVLTCREVIALWQ